MVTCDTTLLMLDNISAAIFVLEGDAQGRPVFAAVNHHALRQAGRPLSDYIGRTALQVYPAAYGRAAFAKHAEAMTSGLPVACELSLPMAGTLRTVSMTLNPVKGTNGRVSRIFGTYVDVSPENNARTARAEFDTLSSEMEAFVALAAHDLRAPMTNIAVLTDMLRKGPMSLGENALEIVDLIDTVAARSLDLISDVLAQAEAAASPRHQAVFSFPVMCHDICMTLDPQRMHHIETSLASVKAEKSVVQIAIRNLLENAIRHGGKDRLKIGISAQDGIAGLLDITLTNDGNGYPADVLDAVNRSPITAGNGFGLFGLSRMICARGGMLIARNLPEGGGASVRFSIPGQIVGHDPLSSDLPDMPVFDIPPTEVWPRHTA